MTTFRLIVDSAAAPTFDDLGRPERLAATGLSRITWDDHAIAPKVRAQILANNQAGITCFYLPVRPWQAAFFDMDSTVIGEESINELARAAGREAEVAAITEQAMAGHLDFAAALRERVRMLKGLPSSILDNVSKTLTINPGMHQLSASAKSRGIKLYLVSGGFNALAAPVVLELGFDGYHANELESIAGTLTGEVSGAIVDGQAKARFLLERCAELGIDPADALAVGDGANDLPMMQAAGGSLGYFPKSILLPHISGAIYHDLSALIHAL